MTAAVASKVFRIRARKSGKVFTFRCSQPCEAFGRQKTAAGIEQAADDHANFHARRGEATSLELGGLL